MQSGHGVCCSLIPDPSFEFDSCSFNFINTTLFDFLVDETFWDFGNGTTSNEYEPSNIIYDEPGEYIVTLTICNDNGCNTAAESVNVPLLDFFIPSTVLANEPVFLKLILQSSLIKVGNLETVECPWNKTLHIRILRLELIPSSYSFQIVRR